MTTSKNIIPAILIIILIGNEFLIAQPNNSNQLNKIKSLIDKFSDEDPWVNGEAIDELVKIGESSVNQLIESLTMNNENVRWCSAIALEKISPKGIQSIPYLINALKDDNSNVRWFSALALGKFKGIVSSSVPELQKLLYDEDNNVRWAAFCSISKIDKSLLNVVPDISDKIKIVESLIPKLISELNVPGVSISIINNNQISYSKTFGISDAGTKTPVEENTMFEACSMSKPVFAMLALKLVQEGKLDLDTPLFNYYAENFVSADDDYSKQITARMILTHTSGMPNWRMGDEERNGPIPVYFKPGLKFNYSGEGIYYLQRVIENITKQPLEIFANDNLFDKLNLKSTSFVWRDNFDGQISTGHNSLGNCNERKKYLHANAAFTLYTTSNDYAKIILELMNSYKSKNSIISNNLITEMLSHQVRVESREVTERPGRNLGLLAFRGLGWAIDSTITGDVIYHSGANQTGFRCYSQFSPKDGSGIVIMTNGENGSELWTKLIKKIGDI
ncbi:MAG: serine hydrolase [Ignavibacteriales bacterium]|nr:serine hydrolase [Ignavibacteriales bacterium]